MLYILKLYRTRPKLTCKEIHPSILMTNNNENESWDWECQEYNFEDSTNIEISNWNLGGMKENEDHFSSILDDETTPVKACGELTCHVIEKGKAESEECREPSSQAKRRRMLQFESEVLNAPLYNDDIFLRSKETQDSLEANIHDMSEWVSGFADGASASNNECLDPSFEGWIADYFNETEIHCIAEDMCDPSGASDVQINIKELCKMSPEYDANAITNHPVNSRRSGAFKGRKSYMCTLPKPSSSVVYPFAFIKPCGAHGDMTLEDINQKLHAPPKSKQDQEDDPSVSYPTSAFSGKPVVGKTKIPTEGGEGSITIMRTKG
ncbi:protein XRI1-like isoform X2 [Primulina tabacum]|uniref:protein XRI1-like isoform X2 n=1 Tax=Primulina tabacum TaxID=48773 RepID=UPI003F5A52F9